MTAAKRSSGTSRGKSTSGKTPGSRTRAQNKRYGEKAGAEVEKAMRERKKGTLRSGSGKKVKSRKQAIAIGLSKARKAGAKVPPGKWG